MDDDEKADLARRGMKAAELLEPGKLREEVTSTVSEAAGKAALRGLAAVSRMTGGPERSPARTKAVAAVDLSHTLELFDAEDDAAFEARLREAAARKARADEEKRFSLAELRRSFPEPSRELALLVFNCVDLLEELSDDAEGRTPSPSSLERKERLLTRIGELLAPRAGEALESFVSHVVSLSREHRGVESGED